jgi:hypothetical protein
LRPGDVYKIMEEMGYTEASLRVNPQVVARQVADRTVLVHLDTNRIFALNETAGRTWELLSSGLTRDEIRGRLLERYAVDSAALDTELDTVFAEWTAEGLVIRE